VALLEVFDLTRRFGGLIAVNSVTLAVEPGEIRGLIGPNGAGKTTLFNLLTGTLRPTAGHVRLRVRRCPARRRPPGASRHRADLSALAAVRRLHRLPQRARGLHVQARAGFWAGLLELPAVRRHNDPLRERALEIIRFVGLGGHEDDEAGSLSHGHKRLLQVAIGLAPSPRLLLLDEPVAGLLHADVDRMMVLVQSLRDVQGITVVLVEHNMQAVMRVCDRITVLQFGSVIAEGAPAAIAADAKVIEAYLGVFEDDAAEVRGMAVAYGTARGTGRGVAVGGRGRVGHADRR
jgi:branched-chain amino acid transport system ATP-binding protein